MCGIAGKMYFNACGVVSSDEIRRMNDAQKHRGPDGEGMYISDERTVGLGHRRLAVIDRSENARQPMSNEDGKLWIVFNGEVYNFQELRTALQARGHIFKSRSDTEVILHLYEDHGEKCLQFLKGMFAFALWDEKQRKLLLARDRFGKKPLKYHVGKNYLVFASELKSFIRDIAGGPRVDDSALPYFFAYNHVSAPTTGFKGVYQLPPAHYMIIREDGSITTRQYWQLDFVQKTSLSYGEAQEELKKILTNAVRARLIADVPVGIFLSGGFDSAVITALASEYGRVKTFTAGFKEFGFDERPLACLVAERFSTDHTELEITPNITDMIPQLVRQYEMPYADSSALPTFLLAEHARKQATVALTGDGGDEAFGGYKRYVYWNILKTFKKTIYDDIARYFYFQNKHSFIYTADFLDSVGRYPLPPARPRTLDDVFALGLKTFLPDDLLVKIDIASMAHGLEIRSPFLDVDVIEFSARLPASWKLRGFTTKRIIKDAFARLIPAPVMKGKRGFEAPVDQWFRTSMYELARGIMFNHACLSRGYFRQDGLERLFSEHRAGKNHGQRIWTLVCFELWRHNYFDQRRSATIQV